MKAAMEHRHAHARPGEVGFSILRMSAGGRLAGAALVSAALWSVVLWAMAS